MKTEFQTIKSKSEVRLNWWGKLNLLFGGVLTIEHQLETRGDNVAVMSSKYTHEISVPKWIAKLERK